MRHWKEKKHAWALVLEEGDKAGTLVGIYSDDLMLAHPHHRGVKTKLFATQIEARARAAQMATKAKPVKVIVKIEECK